MHHALQQNCVNINWGRPWCMSPRNNANRRDLGWLFPVAFIDWTRVYSTNLFTSHHSFISSVQTRGWHCGVKEEGEQRRTEKCRWTGIRTKDTEEQQVPYAPAPLAGFVPALSLQQFKSSLHKLGPWEERTDQRAPNHCHSGSILPGSARKGTLGMQYAQVDELATRD